MKDKTMLEVFYIIYSSLVDFSGIVEATFMDG